MTPEGDAGQEFDTVLAAARRGAPWAWERLLGDVSAPLLGYLRMRGASDPEDLAGEVFLRVARTIARFRGDETRFRSWVFTIAHHLAVDERRRRAHRPSLVPLDGIDHPDTAWDEPSGLDTSSVRALLERLTPDQRDVIVLRVVAGFSIAEVGDILRKDPNAVKQLQHRALGAMRRLLDSAPGDRSLPSTDSRNPVGSRNPA